MASPFTEPAAGGIRPALRDPAWSARVFWTLAGLVLLWPLLVLTEFKPWLLLEPGALKPAGRFLADFVPPKLDGDFLALVARETWRTVAIATAGLTLALLLAIPLALLAVRVLSISALTGRMAPFILARLAFGPKRLPASVMKTPSSRTRTSTEPTFKTLSATILLRSHGTPQGTGY